MNYYKNAIANVIIELNHTKENLIDNLFQIAITGELKDWAETVDIGEHFFFSRDLFESLEDERIKKLLTLIGTIENVIYDL